MTTPEYRYHDDTINHIEAAISRLKVANGLPDVRRARSSCALGADDLQNLIDELEGMLEYWKDATVDGEVESR